MSAPLHASLRNLLTAGAGAVRTRVVTAVLTGALALTAIGLLIAAGVYALNDRLGFPAAAVAVAAVVAVVALAVHVIGRKLVARRTAQLAAAKRRAEAATALATALTQSARPLLPIAAFLAAYTLVRRW